MRKLAQKKKEGAFPSFLLPLVVVGKPLGDSGRTVLLRNTTTEARDLRAWASPFFQYTQSKTEKGGRPHKTQLSQPIPLTLIQTNPIPTSLSPPTIYFLYSFSISLPFSTLFISSFPSCMLSILPGDKADSPPFRHHHQIKQFTTHLNHLTNHTLSNLNNQIYPSAVQW